MFRIAALASILLSSLSLVLSETATAANLEKCLVLDLDATLVEVLELPKTRPAWVRAFNYRNNGWIVPDVPHILQGQPTFYRDYFLYEGATQFLQAVARETDFKIKFFSAGLESRNQHLVWKLLTQFSETKIAPGFEIHSRDKTRDDKKDLTAIGCDPAQSVLIDDQPPVIAPGQESCLLQASRRFEFINLYNQNFDLVEGDENTFTKEEHKKQIREAREDLAHFYAITGMLWEAIQLGKELKISVPASLQDLKTRTYLTRAYYQDKGENILSQYTDIIPESTGLALNEKYGIMAEPGPTSTAQIPVSADPILHRPKAASGTSSILSTETPSAPTSLHKIAIENLLCDETLDGDENEQPQPALGKRKRSPEPSEPTENLDKVQRQMGAKGEALDLTTSLQ